MITARFNVNERWGQDFGRAMNMEAKAALEEASKVGAQAASRLAQPRNRSDKMVNVDAVEVLPTTTGWVGGFRSEAGISGEFYSGFQSRGTLGARTRKVKEQTEARRRSRSGQIRYAKVAGRKGITPLKHEERALQIAKRHLIALLERHA